MKGSFQIVLICKTRQVRGMALHGRVWWVVGSLVAPAAAVAAVDGGIRRALVPTPLREGERLARNLWIHR